MPKKRSDPTSQLARGELVHAEVKPLDLSGIPSVITGIVLWAVAGVVLFFLRNRLTADGLDWWLWVPVAGFGLGLIACGTANAAGPPSKPGSAPPPRTEPPSTQRPRGQSSDWASSRVS